MFEFKPLLYTPVNCWVRSAGRTLTLYQTMLGRILKPASGLDIKIPSLSQTRRGSIPIPDQIRQTADQFPDK